MCPPILILKTLASKTSAYELIELLHLPNHKTRLASAEGLLFLSPVPGASPHLQLLNWTAPLLGNRWTVAVGACLLSPAPGNTGLAPVAPAPCRGLYHLGWLSSWEVLQYHRLGPSESYS